MGAAQHGAASAASNDPRVGSEAGAAERRRGRAQPRARRAPAEAGRVLRSEDSRRRADRPPPANGGKPADPRPSPPRPQTSRRRTRRRRSRDAIGGSASTSPTPTWRSAATVSSSATSTASTPTTSSNAEEAEAAVVGGLPRRPGRRVGPRQPAVHVGRADARPPRLRHERRAGRVSPERFRGVRIFDISDVRKPTQIAAVQTCRGSHTHTLVTDPKDTGQHLHLRVRHRRRPRRRGAGRLFRARPEGRSQHRALQHRRHPDPAGGAADGEGRQSAAHLRRFVDRRDCRPVARAARTAPARRRRR